MRSHIALLHKDAGSDDGVSFPDLPGVITAGSDLAEARAMAADGEAVRVVRVNFTLPEDLPRDIDDHAEARGFTRSGYLQAAAKRALAGA